MKIRFLKIEQLTRLQSDRLWEVYRHSYTVTGEEFLDRQRRLDRVALYLCGGWVRPVLALADPDAVLEILRECAVASSY